MLIRVPAGPFTMGSRYPSVAGDDKPQHRVTLAAYAIGKLPVTNEQFERFVASTGYDAGEGWRKYASEWGAQAPVVCVSWDDAQAYCGWAGLRLPTEAEWEKAARGTDARRHPWGNTRDPERAWFLGKSGGRAHEVGTLPAGISPYGCLDMEGNVWEWCSSLHRPYPYRADDGREDPAQTYAVPPAPGRATTNQADRPQERELTIDDWCVYYFLFEIVGHYQIVFDKNGRPEVSKQSHGYDLLIAHLDEGGWAESVQVHAAGKWSGYRYRLTAKAAHAAGLARWYWAAAQAGAFRARTARDLRQELQDFAVATARYRTKRVLRGGSWHDSGLLGCADRHSWYPKDRLCNNGFRVSSSFAPGRPGP